MNKMVNGVLALLTFAVLSCDLLNQVGSGVSESATSVKENGESDKKEGKTNRKDSAVTGKKVLGANKKADVAADKIKALQNSTTGNKQGGSVSNSNAAPSVLGTADEDDDPADDEDELSIGDFEIDPNEDKQEEEDQGESIQVERVANGGSFNVTEDLHGPSQP
ncbi:hypothetical protein [Borrelia sp. RT5S]|uniref:hypothetical protein n=1 Tax=Borrelia sp. RT5S TaxID=2898581 RepID=UPI001E44F2F1|nr:hypothetical protein [Borrelia sp. RT5S]UGQ16379.1 hypothetical protein LSO06_03770 [Borrelia sp. RT5S]